jgi:type I site-specific restriction endonuclease
MPSPEELARQKIDALLSQCGWILQNRSTINLSAGRGIAIREALLKDRDEVDYLLFAEGRAIGTVEAKPEGFTLTGVEEQSGKYGKGLLDIYPKWREPLPFAYETTGVETFSERMENQSPWWKRKSQPATQRSAANKQNNTASMSKRRMTASYLSAFTQTATKFTSGTLAKRHQSGFTGFQPGRISKGYSTFENTRSP